MAQKVIKIGSSIGMVFPKNLAEQMNMKAGDAIQIVEVSEDGARIEKVPPRKYNRTIDPYVIEWTNVFIEKNRTLLERLAKR